jgi:hypothetical protein
MSWNLTKILIQLHMILSKRDIKVKPETNSQVHEKDASLTFSDDGISYWFQMNRFLFIWSWEYKKFLKCKEKKRKKEKERKKEKKNKKIKISAYNRLQINIFCNNFFFAKRRKENNGGIKQYEPQTYSYLYNKEKRL